MPSLLPQSIQKVIDELAELPGIGPRQATRLAFYLVARGPQAVQSLGNEIASLGKIKLCERCFFVHEEAGALCPICSDPSRNQNMILIIEKETDLLSIENTNKFRGRYFILGNVPKTGLLEDWQKLRLQALKKYIEKGSGQASSTGSGQVDEIILGFNPSSLGDFHSSLIKKELEPYAKKISRLGRGLPVGGEIEFADDETLGSALEART